MFKLHSVKPLLTMLLLVTLSINADEKEGKVVKVSSVKSIRSTPYTMVSGMVYSRHDSRLTTGVEGQLKWVQDVGVRVNKGDVVAELDKTDIEIMLLGMDAKISKTSIQTNYLEKEYKRLKSLLEKNLVSDSVFSKVETDYQLSIAELTLLQSEQEQLNSQLRKMTVKAPFNGMITEQLREIGEDLEKNSPIVRLVDLNNMEIRVYPPLQHAPFVKTGDQLNVFSSHISTRLKVRGVVPASDQKTQTFEVRLSGLPDYLKVGEQVTVAIPTQPLTDAIAIHRDALVLTEHHNLVFRVLDGVAHATRVRVLGEDGDYLIIAGDVNAGEQVVIRGAEILNDGDMVQIL